MFQIKSDGIITSVLGKTPTQLVLHWNKTSALPIINVTVVQKPAQTGVLLVLRRMGRALYPHWVIRSCWPFIEGYIPYPIL